MGKLVMIDSQIFIWGIKEESTALQVANIPYAKAFIDSLNSEDKILLPVPMLAEVLTPVPVNEHEKILSLIDKRFYVAPFDKLAATKCAELIHLTLTKEELIQYRQEHKITKNKLKFDCMLVAVAITRGVDIIYSEDPDIIKFANGFIQVEKMPIITIQTKMFENIK